MGIPLDAEQFFQRRKGLAGSAQSAWQGPTDPEMKTSVRLLPKPRIEGYQLEHLDFLQVQLFGNPLDPARPNISELLLPEVKKRKNGAALGGRVLFHHLVGFLGQGRGDCPLLGSRAVLGAGLKWKAHRSHSPITKSMLPRTAGTSLTVCPGKRVLRIPRLQKDGARILRRWGTPPPRLFR